jgi:hypothetical protein
MFGKRSKMKNSSYATNDLKRVLSDLLIIATVFVCLSALNSTAFAIAQRSLAGVWDNQRQYGYKSIQGNQITRSVSVSSTGGEASFVCLLQPNGDFYAVGFAQGNVPVNNTDGANTVWLPTPYYYVDHICQGHYIFSYFAQAPVNQNYQYMIFLYFNHATGTDTMYAFVNAVTLQTNLVGYANYSARAVGEAETHNTLDEMNSRFTVMRAGPEWLLFYDFQNGYPWVQPRYPYYNPYIVTQYGAVAWDSTGRGDH